MNTPNIRSFEQVVPMIYAYSHPDNIPHQGWTKIGYTEKQSVEERVRKQHHTSDIAYKILWRDNAIYKDGSGLPFTDHEFHHYLSTVAHVKRKPKTEWFQVDGAEAREYFDEFAARRPTANETGLSYTLREEQDRAVSMTADWFGKGGKQFLWNAKPRFGKTLSTYDLIVRMGFQRVLMTDNALKCKFIGGTVPIGYVIDNEQHFQIDPITAPYILEVFKRYDGGATMTELRDWLNAEGVKNTRGNPITCNSIQHILNNRRYIGEFAFRDTVIPDGIPAIVPLDLFNRVQEKLAKPRVSEEQVRFFLQRFRALDIAKPEQRKTLIDVFLNAVYVFNDKIVISCNYKDGTKTINFSDMECALTQRASIPGSDLDYPGARKRSPHVRTKSGVCASQK